MDHPLSLERLRLLLPPVKLVCLAVWSSLSDRDTRCYGRALELLEAVNRRAPSLVSYRHFAKMVLGLRAKMILEMFLEDSSPGDIRLALNRLFPEEAPANGMATVRDLQKVSQIQQQFRELVFKLLSDPVFRISFLEGDMQEQYGEEFLSMLQKLMWEYLQRLHQAQPRAQFEQMAQVAGSSDPRQLQFLITCMKELDPRSLRLLATIPEVSNSQDGESLGLPAEEEPDGDAGGLTLPQARGRDRPQTPGGDGRSPWAPVDGRLSVVAAARGQISRAGAEAQGRSSHEGGAPEPGHAELRHLPLLQSAALLETAGGGREVRVPPPPLSCGRCDRAAVKKRPAPGTRTASGEEDGPRDGSGSDPEGAPRPRRSAKVVRCAGCQDIRGTRRGGGAGGDRPPCQRRSPSVSPSCHWRAKEKENRVGSGLMASRCLDVGGPSERHRAPTAGISPMRPQGAELADVISDSEDEGRDPLTACLGGQSPLQLYHRTKHNTYIPTLVQHLCPLAVHPCYVALERLKRPVVS